MNKTTKQMTFGIMLALVLWGVYLAIGATGMFVQDSMMDPRKSAIVVVCVTLFLGLWATVLFGVNRRRATSLPQQEQVTSTAASENEQGSKTVISWSWPGLTTATLGLVGALLWYIAILFWQNNSLEGTTILGWLAALCILGSATFGMIALSDRIRRRGKWLGLLGLLGFAGSLITFVARMSP